MNEETRKLLGLSADATDEECNERVAELSERAGASDDLATRLEAETTARLANATALATARAEDERRVADALVVQLTALETEAKAAGKFAPGDALHAQFIRLAKLDIEEARAFVTSLPANGGTEVGAASQSKGTSLDSQGAFGAGFSSELSGYGLDDVDHLALLGDGNPRHPGQFAQLGITPEMFAVDGPAARERAECSPVYDWYKEWKAA